VEKVYNSSNNELVRTNTLVKGAIIQVDATPYRVWYEAHVRVLLFVRSWSISHIRSVVRPTSDEEGGEGGGGGRGEEGRRGEKVVKPCAAQPRRTEEGYAPVFLNPFGDRGLFDELPVSRRQD
jgi:ribosomal protein S8E